MKTTTLLTGAVAAVGLTVLGLAFRGLGGPAAAGSEAGKALFPDLMDRVNEVAAVEITGADQAFVIRKNGEVWGLESKGGYPVDRGQVARLILGVAELETMEAKTSDPTRYDKLGVEDPASEGSGSTGVRLLDAGDAAVAGLVVGDVRSTSGLPSVYVRKQDEAQTWLVKGKVDVPADPTALLDKKILELARDEVQAAETTHPDGHAVLVSKDDRDDMTFQVRDVPEGRELRFESVGNGMGQALEYLNLVDVLPAGEFVAPEGEPVRTSYWTWDDLRVDVAVYEKDEKVYASIRARYDEGGAPGAQLVGPMPGEAAPGEAAPGEETTTEEGAEGQDAPAAKTPDEVQEQARALNERLEPWVFEIAAYAKNNFTKRVEDMVRELEPEEPAEGGGLEGLGTGEPPRLEDLLESPPAQPDDAPALEEAAGDDAQAPPPPVEDPEDDAAPGEPAPEEPAPEETPAPADDDGSGDDGR